MTASATSVDDTWSACPVLPLLTLVLLNKYSELGHMCDLTSASRVSPPSPAAGKTTQSPEMWHKGKITTVSVCESASLRALWLGSALTKWLLCWGSSQIEVKKTQIMTQVMDTIHHCPINQGGLPVPCSLSIHTSTPGGVSGSQKPNKEPFSQNEKRNHAQQCCMKRQIRCCGDVCHQTKQFFMSLQEDAVTPGWDWWNFYALMGTGCILHIPSGTRIESMAFGQS